jgi:hypothetical protein
MQQDLKGVKNYILGMISLILALFIPFVLIVMLIFKTIGLIVIIFFMPIAALVVGSIAFVKSLKQTTNFSRWAKILSAIAIVVTIICIAFLLYIFINAKELFTLI